MPKAGFEPAHPGGRQTLNLVRLPFRHFGTGFDYPSLILERQEGHDSQSFAKNLTISQRLRAGVQSLVQSVGTVDSSYHALPWHFLIGMGASLVCHH